MFNLSVNLYRRGLRNDVLVNPKLFIIEKVNLAPHTNGWSNLVKRVKKNCIILYGSLQPTPLTEKFRPRNSYLCHGRDEGTAFTF